ncbi:MAG: hypothetical protein ACKVQR_10225, partial [Aquabacterium sp.]
PRLRLLDSVRRYALDRLAESGEADAAYRQLTQVLTGWMQQSLQARLAPEPAGAPQRNPADAQALAELDNVRGALHWARRHDPGAALRLAMEAGEVAIFTAWRDEAFDWMEQTEPLLDGADQALRAAWTLAWARQLLFRRDPRATAAAVRACELADTCGDMGLRVQAGVARVRSTDQPGEALQHALAALDTTMESIVAAGPSASTDLLLLVAGARAHALGLSGRHDEALAEQQQEVTLARAMGRRLSAAAAESRLIARMSLLGRHEQAAERSLAFLSRPGTVADANTGYVHCYLLHSLTTLNRLDEALAGAAEALAVGRSGGVLYVLLCLSSLLARRGRPRAAALLLGHARHAYARRRESPVPDLWQQAQASLAAALGAAALQRLMTQGEAMTDDAASALLSDGPDPA